ncbi:MAG: alpha-ketoacid dehydrogenase subunit beta [Pseudomonadota bacterium]|nr:alpha-ketoacid dehydrogenase subunit beta [Pseudomonadota bacterium]
MKEVVTILEAINHALDYSLKVNKNVVLLGQDIGPNGGVFRVTEGLQQKYGEERVIDTPLAENMIAGITVGMAVSGLVPIAEFQFMGFIYPAVDQILSHASRMRNRTRGRLTCGAVFRAPYCGGIGAPEHHSESTEAIFSHIPGIRVVIPSSPARAYGLLLAAIENPDPVVFLEPKKIYRAVKQEVNLDGKALPLDKAFVLTEGSDLTLVSWGATLIEAQKAVTDLAKIDISVELIDLATIKPLDMDTIIKSVMKTGRCVIAHEAAKTCGVGAEIAAVLADKCIEYLQGPIKRVTGYDTVMPYYQLEEHYLPCKDRISNEIINLLEPVV